MNSHQRRAYRRALDRMLPPGTRVVDRHGRTGGVWVVRPRISVFERREYNRVMVEREVDPFGHTTEHPNNLLLAAG